MEFIRSFYGRNILKYIEKYKEKEILRENVKW